MAAVAGESFLPPIDPKYQTKGPWIEDTSSFGAQELEATTVRFQETHFPDEDEEAENGVLQDSCRAVLERELRAKMGQPKAILKKEVTSFRMGVKQIILTEALLKGFIVSYSEVFNLDKNYSYLGHKEGLRPRNLSETDVEIICQKFTQWEEATWKKDFIKCFNIMKSLSTEFEDFSYVNDFFLSKAFEAAQKAEISEMDEAKTLADAHKLMGKKFLKQENYSSALEHFSLYMDIVKQAPWKDGSGELNYYIDACNCLRLLYTRMGELCSDPEEILANYQLAHDYAALCDNKLQIKQVSHKLALIHERLDMPQKSAEYLRLFFSLAQQCNDYENIDSASEVFAKAYERIKNDFDVEDTLVILEDFVRQTDQLSDNYGTVCSCLGSIYTAKNDFQTAEKYMNLGYESAVAKQSIQALQESKVQIAINSAHQMWSCVCQQIEANSPEHVFSLLQWKETRTNTFS